MPLYSNSSLWSQVDPSKLKFTNCTIAAEWAKRMIHDGDLPYFLTYIYLQDGIRHANNFTDIFDDYAGPINTDLMSWFINYIYGGVFDASALKKYMEDFASKECVNELCPLLGWQGYSDLSGRGMLINYIIQAILATLYLLVLIPVRLDKIPERMSNIKFFDRGIHAFLHSSRIFLDTSVIFAISMLIAAIYTLAKGIAEPESPLPTYYSITTAYMSLYSVIPAVLLSACVSNNVRRTGFRSLVWIFVATLSSIVIVLYILTPYMPERYDKWDYDWAKVKDPEFQLEWDRACLDRDAAEKYTWLTKLLVGILVGATVLYLLIIFVAHIQKHTLAQRMRQKWWLVVAILSGLTMWVWLGFFIYFRHAMRKGSGESNKDSEWQFGQILTLVMCLPVAIEFGMIWKQGAKKALTGQLMAPYRVVTGLEDSKTGTELSTYQPLRG